MTTTLLALEQLLSEAIGDWLEFDTSTNITTGSTARIVASTLNNYDGAQDDYFNDWFTYITEGNNSGKVRRVKNYETSAGRLDLYGSAFAAETSAVTVRLHRFDRRNKTRALNRAIEQLYPALHIKIDDLTLITGNILPDSSFEWWTSSTALKFGAATNVTLAKTTAGGLYRGQRGTTSMKLTASAANGYYAIRSSEYPRLLDLMNKSVDFYCWVYPEVADDASVEIYTLQADGTAQTLTSVTTAPATKWTKISLLGQALNNNLVQCDVRFKIATNLKYVYFDDAVLCGYQLPEYLLPERFQSGHLSQVYWQRENYTEDVPAYDIHPRAWEKLNFGILDDGTYKYLDLYDLPSNYHRLRLIGYKPLEALSADADTISLDGVKLNLIIAKAAFNLYQMERGTVASEDRARYEIEMSYWQNKCREYQATLTMITPSDTIKGK